MNRFVYDNGYITMKRLNCTLLRARLTACCLLLPLQPPPFFTPIGSLLLSFVRTYAGRSVGVAKAITNAEKITEVNFKNMKGAYYRIYNAMVFLQIQLEM